MSKALVSNHESGVTRRALTRMSAAHFGVRDTTTSCLKLRDERTQRGHRISGAIDPSATLPTLRPWRAVQCEI